MTTVKLKIRYEWAGPAHLAEAQIEKVREALMASAPSGNLVLVDIGSKIVSWSSHVGLGARDAVDG